MKNSPGETRERDRRSTAEPSQHDTYLQELGERVRILRTRRGVSRKTLANHSEVSERYLAQLETGEANLSITLLRRIAKAMGIPVAELVDDRPERPVEALLLDQLVERLSASEIGEAREILLKRFGGTSNELRNSRIALIGLRGGGKSTLGRALAAHLKVPFVELDRIIEQQGGMQLGEIFEMFGQETFRRLERAALESVLQQHQRFVLATGGSIVTEPATFELLLASCFTIWMRASPDEHMQRVIDQGDLRPMADNARAMDDLLTILKSRQALYSKADLAIDSAGKTPAAILKEAIRLISKN